MNKKEVIERLKNHLRGLGYKISEPTLQITKTCYRWCITFISDFLCTTKEDAKCIFENEVFPKTEIVVGSDNQIQEDSLTSLPKGYVSVIDLSDQIGVTLNAIFYTIRKFDIQQIKYKRKSYISKADAEFINSRYND